MSKSHEQNIDPEIARLESMELAHRHCHGAVQEGTAKDASITQLGNILEQRGKAALPTETVSEVWELYNEAHRSRKNMESTLQGELYSIHMAKYYRNHLVALESTFGPLIQQSPVACRDISGADFLGRLFPQGQNVLLMNSFKGSHPTIWNNGMPGIEKVPVVWYWPLSVIYDIDTHPTTLVRSPEAVRTWNMATNLISPDHVGLLLEGILSRHFNVRSVVALYDLRASVTFALDAQNKAEWEDQCRLLRKQLRSAGISVPPFRYDSACHLPKGSNDRRVVYLA